MAMLYHELYTDVKEVMHFQARLSSHQAVQSENRSCNAQHVDRYHWVGQHMVRQMNRQIEFQPDPFSIVVVVNKQCSNQLQHVDHLYISCFCIPQNRLLPFE